MKRKTWVWILFGAAILAAIIYAGISVSRGLSTASEPSAIEKLVARTVRNFAIPKKARLEPNPWKTAPSVLEEAREKFIARCAVRHGPDGAGQTDIGRNLYPKVPDFPAITADTGPDGWPNPLHHSQWRAPYRNAGMG